VLQPKFEAQLLRNHWRGLADPVSADTVTSDVKISVQCLGYFRYDVDVGRAFSVLVVAQLPARDAQALGEFPLG